MTTTLVILIGYIAESQSSSPVFSGLLTDIESNFGHIVDLHIRYFGINMCGKSCIGQ